MLVLVRRPDTKALLGRAQYIGEDRAIPKLDDPRGRQIGPPERDWRSGRTEGCQQDGSDETYGEPSSTGMGCSQRAKVTLTAQSDGARWLTRERAEGAVPEG